MMRKVIFIHFLLIFGLFASAQVIRKEIKRSQFSFSEATHATEDFLYISFTDNNYFDILPSTQFIYKLDYNLNIIDSFNISSHFNLDPGVYLNYVDLSVGKDSLLYSLFAHDESVATGVYKWSSSLLVQDMNLNVIDSFHFKGDSTNFIFFNMCFHDEKLLMTGSIVANDMTPLPALCVFDLKTYSREYYQYDSLGQLAVEFERPTLIDDKILLALNRAAYNKKQTIVVLDSSYHIETIGSILDSATIGSFGEHRTLFGRGGFIPVTNDSIWTLGPTLSQIYPSSISQMPYYWTFGVSLLNPNYNVTTIDTFTLAGYNYTFDDYPDGELYTSRHPMDYGSVDSVLFVQGARRLRGPSYSLQDSTEFYLYNFNARRGQMNWIRKIQRNYSVGGHSVAALPGNRWLLVFNEYDWDRYSGENLSVHIWILNGNGDILSTRRLSKPAPALSLFPNPAQDFIQFSPASHWHGPLRYAILDLSGKSLREGTVSTETAQVSLQDLAPGTYFLHLRHAGEEVRGRFVVE